MCDLSDMSCSPNPSQKGLRSIGMQVVHNHIYHTICGLCEPSQPPYLSS